MVQIHYYGYHFKLIALCIQLICSTHIWIPLNWGGWDPLTAHRHRQRQADADVCGRIPSLHSSVEFARHPINGIKDIRVWDTENLDLLYDLLEPYADGVHTYTYTYTHACMMPTYIHTYTEIYIYVCVCVCVCV